MHTTILGKGSKCRVCLSPLRLQIESLLGRGAKISALQSLMGDAFSRRALYRHREKHLVFHAPAPAARPVPYPDGTSVMKRLRWLQNEVEHTAAIAEYKGDISVKLKALHELARLLWLEHRIDQGANRRPAIDVTEPPTHDEDTGPSLSPEDEARLEKAFELSMQSIRRDDDTDNDAVVRDDSGLTEGLLSRS